MRTNQFLGCVAIASAMAIAPAMAKGGPTAATKGHPATTTAAVPTTASSAFQPQLDPLGPKSRPTAASQGNTTTGVDTFPPIDRGPKPASTQTTITGPAPQ